MNLTKQTVFLKVEASKEPIPEDKFTVPVVFKTGVITEMFSFDVKPDYEYLRETSGYVLTGDELVSLLNPTDEEIANILKESFSQGLTGDSYADSANKEIIDKCVYSETKIVKRFLTFYATSKAIPETDPETKSV